MSILEADRTRNGPGERSDKEVTVASLINAASWTSGFWHPSYRLKICIRCQRDVKNPSSAETT